MLFRSGEVGVSNRILKKADKLNQEEVDLIRSHPASGVSIIEPIKILKPVVPLVLHHHERFDGSGYPQGLKERAIPIIARIFACADAFDAMTSDRPYRSKMNITQAVRELKKNSGTQFDPYLVKMFTVIIRKRKNG